MAKVPLERDRKRRSAPKTRTGCLTCKIRRVKCGEERPSCTRCVKFGTTCDGYTPRLEDLKKAASERDILPRTKRSSPNSLHVLVPISASPVANDREYRYFDLFCAHTGFEIMPSHDSGAIRQILLQACHSDPSIKHAIVAIGALDKTAETTMDFGRLSLDNVAEYARSNEHHQFALEQYAKSVANMRAGGTLKDVRTTLLSILLIFCFEAWNGNMELAVKQIRNGVKIIQDWKSAFEGADMTIEGRSPAPHVIEDDLISIFCRLVVQLSYFANEQTADLLGLYLNAQKKDLINTMPKYFTTTTEAIRYHQAIYRRGTLFFSSFIATPPPPSSQIGSSLLSEQKFVVEKSLQWLKAFEPLYKAFETGYSDCESRLVRTSKAHILIAWIIISTFFTDQMDYDNYNEAFAEVVTLVEESLALQPVAGKLNPTNYSLAGRAVSTMWIVGIRCRDSSIRRKALALLLKYPRREGVWDSLFCAKHVEFIMGLEEQYLEDGTVPECARISVIKWEANLEKRTAVFFCPQRISSSSEEVAVRTTTVKW